jgi:hypothetical protein
MANEQSRRSGFTTYIVRQDPSGQWSFVVARKLLGLFTRPEEIYPLRDYRAAVIRCWVEDGVDFNDVHLESLHGKRELVAIQLTKDELQWFEKTLRTVAGLPVERE